MLKHALVIVGLLLSLGVFASEPNPKDIIEYATRTAKDYCGPENDSCVSEFSNQVIIAYKDGQMDSRSRFRENTLSKRYEKRLLTTECIPSDDKFKDVCASMVDRLVDSYNRGLNSK